jgi:phosphatidylserine/phosphatidylglycerophosphate/cardiolipin synthase-like enzyme
MIRPGRTRQVRIALGNGPLRGLGTYAPPSPATARFARALARLYLDVVLVPRTRLVVSRAACPKLLQMPSPTTAALIETLDSPTTNAVLAYLNLPPVGGFADAAGPVDKTNDGSFELPTSMRQVLRARRDRIGTFRSAADLMAIEGFGADELSTVLQRVNDLSRCGNRLRPVWGGPEGEREFFQLLESAERYIHISTFIVGGQVGLRLAELLARKQREGVIVRVLFCASGFVISGSPSGTGFVSRWSTLRSWAVNDMYVRKKFVRQFEKDEVPFINNVPIGRHWRRKAFKDRGIKTEAAYLRQMRAQGVPDSWIDEQVRIDAECGVAFANVDHRKMVIVDGERAFIGSQNAADSYFYSNRLSEDAKVNVRNWQWHDNSAVLEGPAVLELCRLFAMRWMLSGGDMYDWQDSFFAPKPKRVGNAIVTVDSTIPGTLRVPIRKNLGRIIRSLFGGDARPLSVGNNSIRDRIRAMPLLAENDYYVEHCYPSDSELLEYWASIAPTVKNFTMVVPFHYDTKVLGMECDRMYPELIKSGIRVEGFARAILHSKISVVDGWYTATGSYNLTLRSARADLETEFFIQCPDYGEAVRRLIRKDMELSHRVEPKLAHRIRSRFSLPVFDAIVRYFLL